VHAHATDTSGHNSATVTAYYADVTKPDAPQNLTVENSDHDNLPVASDTAEPNSTVTVHWVDGTTTTVVVDSKGDWQSKATTPQGGGDVSADATYHYVPGLQTVTLPRFHVQQEVGNLSCMEKRNAR